MFCYHEYKSFNPSGQPSNIMQHDDLKAKATQWQAAGYKNISTVRGMELTSQLAVFAPHTPNLDFMMQKPVASSLTLIWHILDLETPVLFTWENMKSFMKPVMPSPALSIRTCHSVRGYSYCLLGWTIPTGKKYVIYFYICKAGYGHYWRVVISPSLSTWPHAKPPLGAVWKS